MNTERAKRKLSAILSADVKGYSRLMGEDEVATVRTLKEYRDAMSKLIKEYRGRVVDSPGDNVLAEFASVVDALECSIEIQKTIKVKNTALADNRKMEFRIGVNLGDVIEDEDRVYGDGVNIAARIEGLAEPGGICISGSGFEQVRNKLPLGYQYLGEHTVKNIVQPIKVYRVLMEPEQAGKVIGEKGPKRTQWWWATAAVALLVLVAMGLVWNFYWRAPKIEPASKEKMAFPLPDKPSIAVLPFANMSGDSGQEFLSDGITENIITGLSQIKDLFVIARNSSFTFKGKPVKVQQVAENLGVRYVLEGSVQRSGERLRITAQFIDALKGYHLWSERYDRELKDLFAVEDDITKKIITALQVILTQGEQARLYARGTENLDAYLKAMEAREQTFLFNKVANALARQKAEEAISLDPGYSYAYGILGKTYIADVFFGWSPSPKEALGRAFESANKALALDESSFQAHTTLAHVHLLKMEHDAAVRESERAAELAPNAADSFFNSGIILRFAGRARDAIPAFERAIRMNPIPPASYLYQLALSYTFVGEFEKAVRLCKEALIKNPDDLVGRVTLIVAYGSLGREQEAKAQVSELLRVDPKFSLEQAARTWPYKKDADRELVLTALRKAGIPDKSPLSLPDKPSIAVLPFVNMSDDPKQEFFADGLAEEIINGLTKVPQVFVIARNSTFTYKGKNVDVKQVGREMGVKYVLEGSVRREGDRVRITTQLVDATSGNHIFSERYDRDLKDIFALQDEITMKVLTAMRVKWAYGEHERAMAKGTKNLEAYLKVMQGWEYCQIVNKESQARARQLAEEAIALDRGYAQAYRLLAQAIAYEVLVGSYQNREEALSRAMEMAQKAVSLDDTLAGAHATLGYIALMLNRDYGKAIAEAERAVALEPNSAEAYFSLGSYLFWSGRFEEGIMHLKKALSFTPIEPARYLNLLAHCYAAVGQYEEAISIYKKIIQFQPDHRNAHLGLVCAYVLSGREEEARNQTKEILRIDPKFTIQEYVDTAGLLYKDQAFAEKFRYEPLRKAGLN